MKFKFAEMETKLELLRSLLWRGIWELEKGSRGTQFSSMVKLTAGEVATAITQQCLEMHGGAGYLEESLIEKLMRDSKLLQIFEGSEMVQKLIIADVAIRLSKEARG
jgi:alkylation response protein AidB-like acyl-CoA dehydrogenase